MKVARVAAAAIGIASAFAGTTLLALEGNEVVVVRTKAPTGAPRRTRAWVADADGYAWIEAAHPARGFLTDLHAGSPVEIERGGAVLRCDASAVTNPDGHARIRSLLAAKYGWADCWIGMLTDTSESVAVRLACR